MTTKLMDKPNSAKMARVPKELRDRIKPLLLESYAYMDSPLFRHRGIERELFAQENSQPELPITSWYQPTREDLAHVSTSGAPQLMKGPEERLMFLRFNYAKLRLS